MWVEIETGSGGEDLKTLEDKIEKFGQFDEISGIIEKFLKFKIYEQIDKNSKINSEKIQRENLISKHFSSATIFIPNRPPNPAAPSPSVPRNPLLDREAEMMLLNYQTDSDSVVTVRRKIHETGHLITALSSKAAEQAEMADSILATVTDSVGMVEAAEGQLRKAISGNKNFRFWVVMWFLSTSFFLIFLDFMK